MAAPICAISLTAATRSRRAINESRSVGGMLTSCMAPTYFTWRIPSGNPAPGSRNAGTIEYNGGTGKYKDWTGKYPFLGTTQINWADGTATGYATWVR